MCPATPGELRGLRGPEVLKCMATMYRAAFPGLRPTVDDVIAADDTIVLRWHSEKRTVAGSRAWLDRRPRFGPWDEHRRWKDGELVEAWTE